MYKRQDLTSLRTFVGGITDIVFDGSFSLLSATNGGEILSPVLTEVQAVSITIDPGSQLSTDQIESFVDGIITVNNTSVDFSALTDLTNTAVRFNGADARSDLSGITSIDSATLVASSGAMISLPSVTSYTHLRDSSLIRSRSIIERFISAVGEGSVLSLPNLTSITNAPPTRNGVPAGIGGPIFIQTLSGGIVELPQVTSIIGDGDAAGAVVIVTADGETSLVDLTSLSTFVGGVSNFFSGVDDRFEALNGGEILYPNLTELQSVSITIDPGSQLSTDHIESFTDGVITVNNTSADFSALTDLTNTVVRFDGADAQSDLSGVTSIDSATLFALNGAMLSLPGVTSYTVTSESRSLISVSGEGSILSLPNLTSIMDADVRSSELLILASSGGRLELPQVTSILVQSFFGRFTISSEGVGSVIDLTGLTTFSSELVDRRYRSTLNATGGGEIFVSSQGLTAMNVDISVAENSTIIGSLVFLSRQLGFESSLFGNGTLSGDLTNAGSLISGRSFRIEGDFTQLAEGELVIDVAEAGSGGFDVVAVGGNVTLGGDIVVTVEDGFTPSAANPDLLFLTPGAITGQFSSIDSDEYVVVEVAEGLALRVQDPEPANARLAEEDSGQPGQFVASDLQLILVPAEEERDDVFATISELELLG